MFPTQNGTEVHGFPSFSGRLAFPSDPALFEALELSARKFPCDEDRILFRQGDKPIGLYLIRSGTVHGIVRSDDGKVVAVFHGDPGVVLGLPAVSCNRPYSLSALAREGSDIGFVAKSDFEKLIGEPAIYMAVFEGAGRRGSRGTPGSRPRVIQTDSLLVQLSGDCARAEVQSATPGTSKHAGNGL